MLAFSTVREVSWLHWGWGGCCFHGKRINAANITPAPIKRAMAVAAMNSINFFASCFFMVSKIIDPPEKNKRNPKKTPKKS